MSLRTRLAIFVFLFGSAVLVNILALLYVARSVSSSLDAIERIRQRQLLVVQMDARLQDAEAALYRYQINGEAGFKTQFLEQWQNFADDLGQYRSLAGEPQEQAWSASLEAASGQAQRIGTELINLRDQQTEDLQAFLDQQAQMTDLLLVRAKPVQPEDPGYQRAISAMQDSSRLMLSAVTGYIASPDETKRVRFTDAVVNFQQAADDYQALALAAGEGSLGSDIAVLFRQMQTLGSRLIGQRDLQQTQFANFFATLYRAGQLTIVGQIEPHEAANFASEQQRLLKAVDTAILASILVATLISLSAILFMFYLTREINSRVDVLLRAAKRVASGDLSGPVGITGPDEFGRLGDSFNHMMTELATREEHLRALVGKMARIQDEERRLIGLDLHDGLTQLIISANMHLNALNALIGSRLEPEATQELDVGRTLVKQSIDEARKVIAELRPTVIEDFGLKEGLRRYVADISENERWTYEVITDLNDTEILPAMRTAIFRIVQEAITNIRKHAGTSRVRVMLHVEKESLYLNVQDWGRGFNPAAFADDMSHLGLVSMQERAQMLGGSFQIVSKSGEGTSISVILPLTTVAERNENVAG